MSNGFVHSVKVPRIYKVTANIVRRVQEEGASLKSLIYERKHPNVSGIYALSVNTLEFGPQLDLLLQKTQILAEQSRLDPWLARVLITELLWGKKHFNSSCKPVQTILSYADLLQKELECLKSTQSFTTLKKVRRPRYVRINTLLSTVEQAISSFKEEGWKLISKGSTYSAYLQSLSLLSEPYFMQDFHIPEVLAFPSSTSFHNHAGYFNGILILQDKASCLSAHLLNPEKGSEVLDLCAAPGMKTTHLAAKLQNDGTVHAIEIDKRRFETLCEQIQIAQSSCVKPLNADALTLDTEQYNRVRYILVDPSCSGSGIVDRPKQSKIDGEAEVEVERLQNLQSIQVYLLRYALFNFPNVRRVVYSTCSVHPEENERVIDEVLSDVEDAYCLVPIKDMLKENWLNFSSPEYNCGDKCLYSRPDVDLCNGFFVAIFERNFKVPLPECKRKGGNANPRQSNLESEKDNVMENDGKTIEKVSRKKKKRGKRKKAGSTIDKEAVETLEPTDELETSEVVKHGTDVPFNITSREIISIEETVQEISEENLTSRKLGKKRKLKNNDAFQIHESEKNEEIIDEDKEMIQIDDVERIKEDDQTEIELIKKKRKKKRKNGDKKLKETDDNVEKLKEDEQVKSEPVKKKIKKKQEDEEVIETDDVKRSKEDKSGEIELIKKKKKKKKEII